MANFNVQYTRKLIKDLAINDVDVTANLFTEVNGHTRLEITWTFEGRTVGTANVILNLDTGEAQWISLYLDDHFQNRGIYTTLLAHTVREWPKRGIDKIVAGPISPVSAAILETGGFTPPEHDLDTFSVDLKGERAKEIKDFAEGGEEPEWRAAIRPRIQAYLKR